METVRSEVTSVLPTEQHGRLEADFNVPLTEVLKITQGQNMRAAKNARFRASRSVLFHPQIHKICITNVKKLSFGTYKTTLSLNGSRQVVSYSKLCPVFCILQYFVTESPLNALGHWCKSVGALWI